MPPRRGAMCAGAGAGAGAGAAQDRLRRQEGELAVLRAERVAAGLDAARRAGEAERARPARPPAPAHGRNRTCPHARTRSGRLLPRAAAG